MLFVLAMRLCILWHTAYTAIDECLCRVPCLYATWLYGDRAPNAAFVYRHQHAVVAMADQQSALGRPRGPRPAPPAHLAAATSSQSRRAGLGPGRIRRTCCQHLGATQSTREWGGRTIVAGLLYTIAITQLASPTYV